MPIENPKDQPDNGETPPVETPVDKFSLKIGDREYQSPDEIVTKITHQDEHIKTIQEENEKLHQLLEAQKKEGEDNVIGKIDQVLNQLDNVKADSNQNQVSTEELVQKAVDERLEQRLSEREKAELERQNDEECMSAARLAYGEDKFQTTLANKAAEVGMTIDRANQLAKLAPEAWKKLFVPNASPTAAPTRSSYVAPVDSKNDDGAPPKPEKSWSKMTQKERIAFTHGYMNNS